MKFRLKHLVFICSGLFFSLWWFGGYNKSVDEQWYPREEYDEDISKVYFDLGNAAYKRNDFTAAIKHFNTTLLNKCDQLEAYDKLGICYEHLGEKDVALRIYF